MWKQQQITGKLFRKWAICTLLAFFASSQILLVQQSVGQRSAFATVTGDRPTAWPGGKEYTDLYKSKYVEVSDSSENILPPGCDYAKNKIDNSKTYDTCVVGAGLSGTVFAERTANLLGRKVLVIDSRPHIGGNCYDFIDQKTGILRNQYGSHLFHTKIKRVWDYINSNPKAPRWKPWYVGYC